MTLSEAGGCLWGLVSLAALALILLGMALMDYFWPGSAVPFVSGFSMGILTALLILAPLVRDRLGADRASKRKAGGP